jgi:hypothetical protein
MGDEQDRVAGVVGCRVHKRLEFRHGRRGRRRGGQQLLVDS